MTAKEYSDLKEKSERLKQKRAEAEGAFKAALKRLEETWGCSSIKSARTKLEELEAKRDTYQQQLESDLNKFGKKWKHILQN